MARRKKAATGVKVNLADVGKTFPADAEVMVKCIEASLEEGNEAPYFKLKLEGVEEYSGAIMYHNASTSEKSLWRLRPCVEGFGIDIPDDAFELEAEDFVGKYAMCSTFKDRKPDGGFSIKPEDFWPAEDTPEDGGAEGEPAEFDLDDLEDDEIKALAKEMGLKGRGVAALKKKIEAEDEEAILEAAEACDLLGEPEGEEGDGGEGGDEVDLDDLEDDQIKAVAKAAGIKGRVVKKLKAALEELEDDELAEALEEAGVTGGDGDSADSVTEEDINGMDQDALEKLVEDHELDVDLDEFKTLRKKRVAVIDAAEEAEILEE